MPYEKITCLKQYFHIQTIALHTIIFSFFRSSLFQNGPLLVERNRRVEKNAVQKMAEEKMTEKIITLKRK